MIHRTSNTYCAFGANAAMALCGDVFSAMVVNAFSTSSRMKPDDSLVLVSRQPTVSSRS